MTIKVTHRKANQSQEMQLSTAMIVYGITPAQVLQIDAGFVLGNEDIMFEVVERLN